MTAEQLQAGDTRYCGRILGWQKITNVIHATDGFIHVTYVGGWGHTLLPGTEVQVRD